MERVPAFGTSAATVQQIVAKYNND
jgi:hypothetical protein